MSPAPQKPPTTRLPAARGRSAATRTARLLLAPLSFLYACGARLRARRWRGRAKKLPKPVLSVGNLTFGGTGKTPFVIHACRALASRGRRVAILSRGYRSRGAEGNDEAKVIEAQLPGVRHVQDPDRYRAGAGVAAQTDVFVLDDGFQHHPLHRDADIVLVDATAPFGGGACPPGGRLREPLSALERADLVVLTRADLVDRASLGETMRTVRARTAAPVATGAFRPVDPPDLKGQGVLVACGIGNPAAFVAMVESLEARVERCVFFRDHHEYTGADAARLAEAALPVVVTEKDAVKLRPLWRSGGPPLHVVKVAFEPLDGADEIEALFDRLCG